LHLEFLALASKRDWEKGRSHLPPPSNLDIPIRDKGARALIAPEMQQRPATSTENRMINREYIALLKDVLVKLGHMKTKLEELGSPEWSVQQSRAKLDAGEIEDARRVTWQIAVKATGAAREAALLCARLDRLGAPPAK
jgi:hypothetical protein